MSKHELIPMCERKAKEFERENNLSERKVGQSRERTLKLF